MMPTNMIWAQLTRPQSRTSIDTLTSSDDRFPVFSQAISVAFEPYLSVWIEAQDRFDSIKTGVLDRR